MWFIFPGAYPFEIYDIEEVVCTQSTIGCNPGVIAGHPHPGGHVKLARVIRENRTHIGGSVTYGHKK